MSKDMTNRSLKTSAIFQATFPPNNYNNYELNDLISNVTEWKPKHKPLSLDFKKNIMHC